MIKVRESNSRGQTKIDWLNSFHTFSFGEYRDPEHMGYGPLRVINEDYVAPAMGFGRHPHKNMEIITLVLDGELKHEDSLGSSTVINPQIIQKMTAGRGIFHSEFNNSSDKEVHLYQIWIMPKETGLMPSFEEATMDEGSDLIYLAGSKEEGALVSLNQDAKLYLLKIKEGESREIELSSGEKYWFQVISGNGQIEDLKLQQGDGFSVEKAEKLEIVSLSDLKLLKFDLK